MVPNAIQQDNPLSPYVTNSNKLKLVRLRGLPFTASKPDVIRFFNDFRVTNEDIVLETSGGKMTGRGLVQLESDTEAQRAAKCLNKQYMGNRYIEVDLCSNVMEFENNY